MLCRTGRYNLCPSRKGFGYGIDGAMTRWVRVPARCLHSIPDTLPFDLYQTGEIDFPGDTASMGVVGDADEGEDGGAAPQVVPETVGTPVILWRRTGLVAVGAVTMVLALSVAGSMLIRSYLGPTDFEGAGSGSVTVRIEPGASAGRVAEVLAGAGVVASPQAFVNVTEKRAKSGSLRPGSYRMRRGMAAGIALDLLLSPASRVLRKVSLPEGMRLDEALPHIAGQAGLPLKDFRKAVVATLGLPGYARGLEGFLYPATYEVEPGMSAADLLGQMVARFRRAALQLGLEARAAAVHLTPLEAVTVASIVQAEGGTDADYPKIARVIYNRLAGRTPLQLDTTVLYAQSRRTLRVSEADTKVGSPYNTYRHPGLPPGPIANPGEKALLAALYPASGDWYWFVTTDPEHRITKFTNKESEFVRYRKELNDYLGTD